MKKIVHKMLAGICLVLAFIGSAQADYIGNASSFEDVDRGIGVVGLASTFTNESYTTVIKQSISLPVPNSKLDFIYFFMFRNGEPQFSINGVNFHPTVTGEIGGDATVYGYKLNGFQAGNQIDLLFYGSGLLGGTIGLAKNDGTFSPSFLRSGYVDIEGPHYTETEGLPVLFGLNYTPVTSVPEPSTYALLIAGLSLMGFVARRRKA